VDHAPAQASAPRAGDDAPEFTYRAVDGRYTSLAELRAQIDVLLVFGADDATLISLEDERNGLFDAGVMPVVVLDRKDGEVWKLVQRLGLHYSVLSDPRHAVAAPYGAVDTATGRTSPAWFVVDRVGHVRASGMRVPRGGAWTGLAADALGRPGPGQALRTGTR
jgi:peroxiredoxin